MDAVVAINDRIAAIRGTLAALAPQVSTAPRSASPTPPAGAFASVLAAEMASEPGSATGVGQRPGAHGPEQRANAAAIIDAGRALNLSARDQAIGVMTAMGESSLTVVDRGDDAGPDSRGLFQQRANGAWGTYADRMDPTISATNFFTALAGVTGRESMEPTLVAHAVQRNADPSHYARYWDAAVAMVTERAQAR